MNADLRRAGVSSLKLKAVANNAPCLNGTLTVNVSGDRQHLVMPKLSLGC